MLIRQGLQSILTEFSMTPELKFCAGFVAYRERGKMPGMLLELPQLAHLYTNYISLASIEAQFLIFQNFKGV